MGKSSALACVVVLAGGLIAGCEQTPSGGAGRDERAQSPSSFKLESSRVTRGKAIYNKHCIQCHGESGKGRVLDWRIRDNDGHLPSPPLNGTANTAQQPASVLLEIIRDGSPPGQGKMPAWKNTLSEQDMQNVMVYIQSLWSPPVYRLWWNINRHAREG